MKDISTEVIHWKKLKKYIKKVKRDVRVRAEDLNFVTIENGYFLFRVDAGELSNVSLQCGVVFKETDGNLMKGMCSHISLGDYEKVTPLNVSLVNNEMEVMIVFVRGIYIGIDRVLYESINPDYLYAKPSATDVLMIYDSGEQKIHGFICPVRCHTEQIQKIKSLIEGS